MKKMFLGRGGALGLFLLSGCSSYQGTFDCPPGRGVGCRSITEVNALVDQGLLPGQKEILDTKPLLPKNIFPEGSQSSSCRKGSIGRTPEETLEVWIRSYGDEDRHYHEASRVHMVVKESTWGLGL